ncbi:MAG: zinc-ribbon domain-containing protein [Deltaproteobacteria bacterium]|nr:zinc-ribbon domain-containing protein [Deltaproteobacteria bacterium]
MQVACNHCGAQYQFEPTAIPAAGYQAQCTQCGQAFFVAPAAVEVEVSVACSRCGVVYRFPAAAIPAQGYDAECTQCHNIFFVNAPTSPATDKPVELAPGPMPGRASPAAQTPPASLTPVEPAEPVLLKAPDRPSRARGDADAAFTDGEARPGFSDVLALSAELGEPMPAPEGTTPEEDFERILRRKKTRRAAVLTALGIVAGYALGTYYAAPRLFDLSIGRFIGMRRTVNPAAVPHTEKGRAVMFADTDAAYRQAIEHFNAALVVDAAHVEAQALAGLAHALRGHDLQARGRAIHAAGAAALSEIKTIEDAPPAQRPRDAVARSDALRAQAAASRDESSKLYEAGGKELNAGFDLLRAALEKHPDDPRVAEVAAIYYALDTDNLRRAQELLRHALLQRGLTELDLSAPPTAWLAYVQGLVQAAEKHPEAARDAFAAAVKSEPRFQRARYDLLQTLDALGQRAEAQRLAQQIVAEVADHDKARAYLAQPVVAMPDVAAPGKGKKQKGKKRR